MYETVSSTIVLKGSLPECTAFVIVKPLHHKIKQKKLKLGAEMQ